MSWPLGVAAPRDYGTRYSHEARAWSCHAHSHARHLGPASPPAARYHLRSPAQARASAMLGAENRRKNAGLEAWKARTAMENLQAEEALRRWEEVGDRQAVETGAQERFGSEARDGAMVTLQQWRRWRPFRAGFE
eukprot:TRINITY_DN8042_c0_g1_i6.p3 TRINITY_DN8042_c0_g1~~TRINITY_DN8042_c0_g1_i6.p3  ORF type:complete len:135 (-),score=20.14 TRINITY_DN8042_c0_g1_i6:440-844(-)